MRQMINNSTTMISNSNYAMQLDDTASYNRGGMGLANS